MQQEEQANAVLCNYESMKRGRRAGGREAGEERREKIHTPSIVRFLKYSEVSQV